MNFKVKVILVVVAMLLLFGLALSRISTVKNGEVGIRFNLYADKGVQEEVLTAGRYFIGPNEYLYIFPTFRQNKTWTNDQHEDSYSREGFEFQSKNGLQLGAGVGIEYEIAEENAVNVFKLYKKGVDEVTNKVLRNAIRDAFNKASSKRDVEQIYGEGKTAFVEEVKMLAINKAAEKFITIIDIYLIGKIEVPTSITNALNSKIEATQKAQQRENELQMSIAQQKKDSVEAEAIAQKMKIEADAYAYSVKTKAEAQATANKKLSSSITSNLIEYEKTQKWNGVLPQVTSGSTMLNFKK